MRSRQLGLLLAVLLAGSPVLAAIDAELLWRAPQMRDVRLSPDGTWLAAVVSRGDATGLIVQHRSGAMGTAFATDARLGDYDWVDESTLVVPHLGEKAEWHEVSQTGWLVIELAVAGGSVSVDRHLVGSRGRLVHPLPRMQGEVLWGRHEEGTTSVRRVQVDELIRRKRRFRGGEVEPGVLEAELPGVGSAWVVDRRGVVRAARTREMDEEGELLHYSFWYRRGADAAWDLIDRAGTLEDLPEPVGVADDDASLLVSSRAGRETRGLHRMDMATRTLEEEVYVHPTADVLEIVVEPSSGELLAAVVLVRGRRVFHYFDAQRARYQRFLESFFPGQAVQVVSSNQAQNRLVLRVSAPRNPGAYYLVDTESGDTTRIGENLPGLNPAQFSDSITLDVTSRDGTRLEAFLTRPARASSRGTASDLAPLVVLPHGGPIGVSDSREFDPLVQYLASAGLAVLKVNYRGSEGYGRTFLEAGKRQWARGIEDDIEAAVSSAVAAGGVSPERICIAGGSYGGYSALVSVLRRPDLYRCGASLNGPTDLLYTFTSSDFSRTRAGRAANAEIVGDPVADREHLVEISPAYRAAGVSTPLFIAHGSDDRRVDVDHAHRLMLMLDLYGIEYEWLSLPGGGHSPDVDEWRLFAERLRAFLAKHLAVEPPA